MLPTLTLLLRCAIPLVSDVQYPSYMLIFGQTIMLWFNLGMPHDPDHSFSFIQSTASLLDSATGVRVGRPIGAISA